MSRNGSYLADATMPGLAESEVNRIAHDREQPRAMRDLDRHMLRDLGLDRSTS